MTYVVGLFPGVKGLVHLCYMLDRYHSEKALSKDISLNALRPGGEQGELLISSQCVTDNDTMKHKWNILYLLKDVSDVRFFSK